MKNFFGTLASVTRLSLLFSMIPGEKSVKTLTDELGVEQSIVSHGPRRLLNGGLIVVRKEGRERLYSLNPEKSRHVFSLASTVDARLRNKLTIGRELKMIELKRENDKLRKKTKGDK